MKSTLLLTFIGIDDLYDALSKISETIGIPKYSIFVFKSVDIDGYILTYNLSAEKANIQFDSIWPNTISIHRKKQTNTLYSLNAMNQLIKNKNGGSFVRNYNVNWEEVKNSLMIIKNHKLSIFGLQIVKVNQ